MPAAAWGAWHQKRSSVFGFQQPRFSSSLKSISLAPNQGTFDWNHWEDNETSRLIGLHGPHGHEMVLYQWEPAVRDPSSQRNQGCSVIREGSNNEEDDNLASTVLIEELKDENENDGNMADDEECELSDDAPLMDLEEQITDMDLD
ncbi:hypothetical protein BGX23_006618 [Mortierella sp. AD031]|nr:hypothetical protein BGX23_006618 [Mortierella sp. AD031]